MKIIHIAQLHKPPYKDKTLGKAFDDEVFASIVKSQFAVAQAIKQHSPWPVLWEATHVYLTQIHYPPQLIEEVKRIFPNGVPEQISALNATQKSALYEYGAPQLLLLLNAIPIIFNSISIAASDIVEVELLKALPSKIIDCTDPKLALEISNSFNSAASALNVFRETEAIQCAKHTAIKIFDGLEHATVLLVYGSWHNFKPYCDREGFEYVRIETAPQVLPFTYNSSPRQIPWKSNALLCATLVGLMLILSISTIIMLPTYIVSVVPAAILSVTALLVGYVLGAFLAWLMEPSRQPTAIIETPVERVALSQPDAVASVTAVALLPTVPSATASEVQHTVVSASSTTLSGNIHTLFATGVHSGDGVAAVLGGGNEALRSVAP